MDRKVIVLGIDGLEYNLVEEWDLKYLKQKTYTKTDLSDFEVIVTPPIWAAMLTGRIVPEINEIFIRRYRYYSQKTTEVKVDLKTPWYVRAGRRILPNFIRQKINKMMFPDPFKKTADFLLRTTKYKTIFDYYEKTWTNGVPSYGRNVSTEEIKVAMQEAIMGNLKPLVQYSLRIYEEDKKQLFEALDEDYELIFWYTPFLDEISHFYIKKKLKLMNLYIDLNKLVKKITSRLEDNDILYIISDHGMEPVPGDPRGGNHSDHGFFSSNTGEIIKKPQELFYLIVNKSNIKSK
jgi:hypothetical protein